MLRAVGQLLHNISQHDPTMLQDVGWCWIKFENDQILVTTFLDVADVARVWSAPSQHLTTRSNNVARCCVEMLQAVGRRFTITSLPDHRLT